MISSRDLQPIRIIICDDVPEMRSILHDVLSEDPTLRVLGEADNGRDCVRLAGELQPDVVLLDLTMPQMDGLEAIPKIIEIAPQTAIVVYSGLGLNHMATAALAAGADRYIEKGTSLDELAEAFREVAQRR